MFPPQPSPESHSDPRRCSIWVCAHGCVCLQFGINTVHLPREAFFQFMLAAREVLEAMHLGAAGLTQCGGGRTN